jgi:hypothetical protein
VDGIDLAQYLSVLYTKVFDVPWEEVESYWHAHVGCIVRHRKTGAVGEVLRNMGHGSLEVK